MSNKCRYDHTAEAIRALCKYLERSAADFGTMALLQTAQKEIKALVEIEKTLPQQSTASRDKRQVVQSALNEVEKKLKPVRNEIDEIKGVLSRFQPEIARMKTVMSGLKALESAVETMDKINKSVNQILAVQKKGVRENALL